ncbi:MAG: DUF4097 family beta strand repeat protein [Ekhidna sp.]|nr:DUF4097 family beta strand repeat protein [Ekhidna sp.]MBC6409658.1 DUF4097 family beta strand repeat protein [Ekhidna sp.]MBC6426944.1 DUF4097 family beta strand repeat protein [Ekhidna sp.]
MKKSVYLILFILSFSVRAQNIIAAAELKAENVSEVRVEGKFVDVYVKKGDEVYFKGVIRGNGDEGDYRFDTDVVDSTLIIRVIRTKNNYSWKNSRIKEARMDITIPGDVKLDIDNSSGDVFVANLRVSESKIEATSGDITLRNIIANLEVETTSGDIDIADLIGDSEIESTSGDQEFENVKGTIETRASSGDITFEDFEGDLDIKATSGDIDLRGGEGKLKVRTSSGNIDGVRVALTGDAYFDATSGDVKIDFTNDLDDLNFDLNATSGDLEVGSRKGEKRLIIERGEYTVRGTTSSGDQEYE